MRRVWLLAMSLGLTCLLARGLQAQVRLIGITGNQEASPASDETLFEINLTNAATTRLFQTSHVPDTDSIGYNPMNGLLYHISGASSYRDAPDHRAYRDNQTMETYDMEAPNPEATATGVFNANPPGNPDVSQEFGLPAPFPDWVLPDHPRREDEVDEAIGDLVGPGEFDSARGMAYSATENAFYITSGRGIYRLTADGADSTKLEPGPANESGDMKGIAFVQVGNETKLYAGSKESPNLYEIDPATGEQIGSPIVISAPIIPGGPVESNHRILGLTQHPETGALYGLLEPIGSDPIFNRQLVTIDLATGMATLIGELKTPNEDAAFASIAFVGFTTSVDLPGDYNDDGKVDAADYVMWRNDPGTHGGNPAGYNTWRANFGRTAGAGVGLSASAGVPEPGTVILLLAGAMLFSMQRRSRS